jgi:hypothetical protein
MNLVMLNFAPHRFDPFHDGVDVYLNILTESQIHRPRSVSRLQPGNHLVSGKEAQLVPNVALQEGRRTSVKTTRFPARCPFTCGSERA